MPKIKTRKQPEIRLREVEPELHQKLKSLARLNGRTLNGQVLYMLRKYYVEETKTK
jgi:hypothetical protein